MNEFDVCTLCGDNVFAKHFLIFASHKMRFHSCYVAAVGPFVISCAPVELPTW